MNRKTVVEPMAWIMLSCWLLVMPLSWVFSILLAAAVHEAGHMSAVWLVDGQIREIRIGPMGAKICTSPMSTKEELFCALAGPLAGILLCLFFRWIPKAALCAFVQSAFNLLPVYPLDGGRALRCARRLLRHGKNKPVAKASDSVYNNSN